MKSRKLNLPVCCSRVSTGARATFRLAGWQSGLLCLLFATAAARADLSPANLPPPANKNIVFNRDILPLFENICFRCHGPEKPKSDFCLAFRDRALQGGDENTDDIVPGNSAKSYLVYYVARQVEDMEMPPEGRGKPLTPQQVGLLRAWIDQGAVWGTNSAPLSTMIVVEPTLRWMAGSGDQKKFRELEGLKEGWGGGLDHFAVTNQISPDTRQILEGHALFNGRDVRIKLSLEKTDVGFVRSGFEEWRRYYDDTGGYYVSNSPPSFSLNRDLHLDIGRAWIDFGLTLPRWPEIVLGYEYQFHNGSKSVLEWGGPFPGKNIYPAAEDIDEHTHIVKLDVTRDWVGWHIENNARVEIYSLNNHRDDATSYGTTFNDVTENATYVQGANTLSFEKQLKDWWLFSGGYYHSQYDGG
ncbi:MAG TPA: c-type cytochrome domain-containing protein, partial [Verrucomicrobiae bacterium]|nr:c-type cytochrome domain-containing protein [Verrucomicrobiae bacterium]